MAAEVFIDTSGFYARWDLNDPAHERVKAWFVAHRGTFAPLTTAWVIGETCILFVARRVPRLIGPFLDQLGESTALRTIIPDADLLDQTKSFLRKHVGRRRLCEFRFKSPDILQQFVPIHFGHRKIANYNIRSKTLDCRERLLSRTHHGCFSTAFRKSPERWFRDDPSYRRAVSAATLRVNPSESAFHKAPARSGQRGNRSPVTSSGKTPIPKPA
jgi:hypothetical protein